MNRDTRRFGGLGLLLVLLAVIFLLVTRFSGEVKGPTLAGPEASLSFDDPDEVRTPEGAASPSSSESAVEDRSRDASPEEAADPDALTKPADLADDEFVVCCVEVDSGRPIVGAELRLLVAGTAISAITDRDGYSPSSIAEIAPVLSDEDGRARLRHPGTSGRIFAQAPGFWGKAACEAISPHPEVLIELRPLHELPVRVVDETGVAVAGAPVIWTAMVSIRAELAGGSQHNERTDAEGRVRLALIRESTSAIDRVSYYLRLGGIFLPAVDADIDPVSPPSEELTLVMPPHGAVDVLVRRADGKALGDGGTVSVAVANGGTTLPSVVLPLVDGRASCEFIGLGLMLEARSAGPGDDRFRVQSVRFSGPSNPGDRAVVNLVLEAKPEPFRLRGRLLDAEGQPVADTRCYLTRCWARPDEADDDRKVAVSSIPNEMTDEDGRFEIDAWSGSASFPDFLQVTLAPAIGPGLGQEAVWTMTSSLERGLNDIGDLRLAPRPVVLSGRVVDDRGLPVAGANLVVLGLTAEGKKVPRYKTPMDMGAATDRRGRFVIWGKALTERLLVTALATDGSAEDREFPAGSREVELCIRRRGLVSAHIETHLDQVPTDARVVFRSLDGGRDYSCRIDRGRIRRRIPQGRYELAIQIEAEPKPLVFLSIPAIEVSPDHELALGDLGPRLDLSRLEDARSAR